MAIITPELRAALERLRDFKNGDICEEHVGPDGIENYENDLEMIRDAMLELFPEGMPEPVEMWSETVSMAPVATSTRLIDKQNIRGLFIAIERV